MIKEVRREEVGQADVGVVCSGVGLQHCMVISTIPGLTTNYDR